jgi:hypothetical protein
MFCLRGLFSNCHPKRSKQSELSDTSLDEAFELATLVPEGLPAKVHRRPTVRVLVPKQRQRLSAIPEFGHEALAANATNPKPSVEAPSSTSTLPPMPNPIPSPPRIHYISATISPRMLAPFLKNAGFAQGGDERLPLHTFSADWGEGDADEGNSDGEAEYEFIYEGTGGITWPLRKVRVDNRDVEVDDEWENELEQGGVTCLEEICTYVVDTHEIVGSQEPRGDDVGDSAGELSSSTEEAVQLPRKFRVHVHAADAERTTSPRFKVRVRSSKELGNESMRRLPKKRGAMLLLELQATEDGPKGSLERRKDSAGIHEGNEP